MDEVAVPAGALRLGVIGVILVVFIAPISLPLTKGCGDSGGYLFLDRGEEVGVW